MKTILTGCRANSSMHIGNYFGAIQPTIDLQEGLTASDRLILFVPDLHSITTPTDYTKLKDQSFENLKIFLAGGFKADGERIIMFRQSRVSAHAELNWVLQCFTYFGETKKMTQFKDKSHKLGNETVSVGLFTYPILMTGDYLLYDSDVVPVGKDQLQHMELGRDIARRMNNKFSDQYPEGLFAIPEMADYGTALNIRNLQDPTKKMSKSDYDSKGTIYMMDDPKDAAKKIMSAATDSLASVNYDWENQPGITNLLQIYELTSDKTSEEVLEECKGVERYGDFKKLVANSVEEFLIGFQERFNAIDDAQAKAILEASEVTANQISQAKLKEVYKAVGMI